MMYARPHSSIIPGAFGVTTPRLKLSTRSSEVESAKGRASTGGGEGGLGGSRISSMDFSLLFDAAENGAGEAPVFEPMVMETVHEDPPPRPRASRTGSGTHHNQRAFESEDALDPMSVYLR